MLASQAEPQVSALRKSHHPLYRQYQPVSFCTFCSVTCTVISCWGGLLLPCTLYKSRGCADTRGLLCSTDKTTKTAAQLSPLGQSILSLLAIGTLLQNTQTALHRDACSV